MIKVLDNLYNKSCDIYSMKDFKPAIVGREYLKGLGVDTKASDQTIAGLEKGSVIFNERIKAKTLVPRPHVTIAECNPDSIKTEIHNYTGRCPTLTFEVNPVRGCYVGCQYCLVTDGVHEQELVAYDNYHLYVRKLLEEMNGDVTAPVTGEDIAERNRLLRELAKAIEETPEKKKEIERQIVELSKGKNWNHYYYFSPKTEALQEPTLQTGIAHRILHEFIDHFKKHPDSNARLFIASKAGTRHLMTEYEGETIIDLFAQMKDKMQFNTSVSIMPTEFRDILEPNAAPIEERLKAVKLCQEHGVLANSALVQPIFTPYLTDEHIRDFFTKLRDAGIVNYKPEFLTACMENLAMLGQCLGYFDKNLEKALYQDYIMPSNANHRKQRGRTAPDRALCVKELEHIMRITKSLGMTTSICFWVRKQLEISPSMIPVINGNGFQCLGYQSRLFKGNE